MSRHIDADVLNDIMYYEAFENDASYNESNPMAKWDSGLWIRYKMFENVIADAPNVKCKCDFGKCHKQGDTLYEPSDWDGGIGFDYIRDIKYCPLCGGLLDGEAKESE